MPEAAYVGNYESKLSRPDWQADFRVLHQRGRCAQHRGDPNEAEQWYHRALEAGAPASLSQAQAGGCPARPGTLGRRHPRAGATAGSRTQATGSAVQPSVALLRLNRLEDALAASDSCLQLLESMEVSDRDRADLWLNRGTILQELGNRTQARQATEHALQLHPEITNGHTNLGLLAHLDRDLVTGRTALPAQPGAEPRRQPRQREPGRCAAGPGG